ncbi:hypothetical protein C0995_007943 [Termitomyces sp. Mi166|nr:hypothetical protein C0995_007943 [Termitomyces sp. Mi166\
MPASPLEKVPSKFLQIRKKFEPSRTLSFLCSIASKAPGLRRGWTVKDFSNTDFQWIDPSELVEEETLPGYARHRYYPVRIGEVFVSRYQVVGKLGFGMASTVWLARDLKECRYVTLKVYIHTPILRFDQPPELTIYQRLEQGPKNHPGREAIRSLLDSFKITGPDGEYHHCLVHPPLGGSIKEWSESHPVCPRLIPPILAVVLRELFLALDYAKECQVIHTDISASNIMFGIEDVTVLEQYEQAELEHPTPRKQINGRFIYQSRPIQFPGPPGDTASLGLPFLCDFSAALWAEGDRGEDVQPDIYRSPEVILGVPWSYEIDIWNVGCLVDCKVWSLFEEVHLFYGYDEHDDDYSSRGHLSEMIALLGPPPPEFIARGSLSYKRQVHFYTILRDDCKFKAGVADPPPISWDKLETTLKDWEGEGEDRVLFLQFMSKMMQWDPRDRQTAKQLLEDEWLTARLGIKNNKEQIKN